MPIILDISHSLYASHCKLIHVRILMSLLFIYSEIFNHSFVMLPEKEMKSTNKRCSHLYHSEMWECIIILYLNHYMKLVWQTIWFKNKCNRFKSEIGSLFYLPVQKKNKVQVLKKKSQYAITCCFKTRTPNKDRVVLPYKSTLYLWQEKAGGNKRERDDKKNIWGEKWLEL